MHETARAAGNALEPLRPHDSYDFDQLAAGYNFRLTSPFPRVFTRLVIDECRHRPPPVRVLDIGCGKGIGGRKDYQAAVRAHAGELWGLDPDPAAEPPADVFDHHQRAAMEESDLPRDHFDVAYSCMVMEHVADPDLFMERLSRCLKPGGVYLFMTPNRRHYFTRIASTLRRLRIDEFVLRLLRGRAVVESYHHEVRYAFNDERRIGACAARVGLAAPEFAYMEDDGVRGYLPGPLRPVYHVMAAKRRLLRNPRALVTLICRIRKPDR